MNLSLLFKTIARRLARFKLKTIFMGLGITVAVLATVLLQTALMSVENTFASFVNRNYPANGLVLMTGSGFMGGATRANLEISDVETVVSSLGIKQWDPVVMVGPRDIKQEGNIALVNVAGYSEQAEVVRSRSAQEGEFFTAEEVRSRAHVALIGSTTARDLFPGGSPVGASIFIDNVPFTVKGVLETTGVDPHGGDQDNAIWIPYTTLMESLVKTTQLSGATLIIDDPSRRDEIQKEVTQILRERHQIGEGQQDDFSIVTPVSMAQLRGKMFSTWKLFIRLIAGTVFLVAAIVILSIMQISIKGRTAEIGLRKALGARPRDLQIQIVLEVLLVALIASLAGLVLAKIGSGFLASMLGEKFGVKEASPPVLVMLAAVGLAMLTGLVGGLWPARRAARLNPVQALK